jgi:adenosylmethionine-8-amino-7-oxononanoate aminotransferase
MSQQPQCTHLDQIQDVEPSAQGCEDCLKTGDTWVHLRICLICGFGRLGELFGSTYFGVEPDVITTAKGITSSYAPLGAVLVRKSVADVFASASGEGQIGPISSARMDGFQHGLTFGGHPVSCAAAIANLDIMLEEDLPGQAKKMGAYLQGELQAALGEHPNVGDIRGAGLFLGVEMVADKRTKESPAKADVLEWMSDRMLERGLILRNDGRNDPTTQLCPPLIATKEECDYVVNVLAECFDELGKRLGTVGTPVAT